jgi:hypothetical protein
LGWAWAKRTGAQPKYRKTKLKVGLGTLREDGYFWSDPGDWGHTVVVR